MKISYSHLIDFLIDKPSIDEISKSLFQLGHEHSIHENIFDIEFTPNRGDCLSVKGLLRDLKVFFDTNLDTDLFLENIDTFNLDFDNRVPEICPTISFLKISIDKPVIEYKGALKKYFKEMPVNKINFFTDISNYISYETGQPTHCYNFKKLNNKVSLDYKNFNLTTFKTLLGNEIKLTGEDLVFISNGEVINLAGVMGGEDTSCSKNTTEVLVECANFLPEYIIGKTVKYDIQSEAAYKFERGVDAESHEKVIRRFIHLVKEHVEIKDIKIYQEDNRKKITKSIPFNIKDINNIVGIDIDKQNCIEILTKLGFKYIDNHIHIPSYRNDIHNSNDLAEEFCRVIGYDQIPVQPLKIPSMKKNSKSYLLKNNIRSYLVDNGFYEVINNPFVENGNEFSIRVDNPLHSNKEYLRTTLESSLINTLLYNERRQNDNNKFFEISDIYTNGKSIEKKTSLGIIASGRVGNNYKDFTRNIDQKYLMNIFNNYSISEFKEISREGLDTKIKNKIFYTELEINSINSEILKYKQINVSNAKFKKFRPLSEFPKSHRDLSFLIENFEEIQLLHQIILSINDEILRDKFIFDYYKNLNNNEIKLGYRFTFQSDNRTLTDKEIDDVYNRIIDKTTSLDSVSIPGLKK